MKKMFHNVEDQIRSGRRPSTTRIRGSTGSGSVKAVSCKPLASIVFRYVDSVRWLAPTCPRTPVDPVVHEPSLPYPSSGGQLGSAPAVASPGKQGCNNE